MNKLQKLQISLKKTFDKLLQDYGQPVKINGTLTTAIYVSKTTTQSLEEFGITPTNQTQILVKIEEPVSSDDTVQLKNTVYRISQIQEYFGIMKKITLEKPQIG